MPCSDLERNAALFDTRLTPRALASVATFQDSVNVLRVYQPRHLHRAGPEAVTISETSFFRDAAPFDALTRTILPRLIRARRPTRTLRIWSAATSTGQEAISLALILTALLPNLDDWDAKITATDISREAIEHAQRGRFRHAEIDRHLPSHHLPHFTRAGDEWAIHPRIAALCDFHHADLCAPLPPLPLFDLILLRNVLLYLPERARVRVLAEAHRHLHPDGYLVLGSSEQAEDSTTLFRVEHANASYFYRPI